MKIYDLVSVRFMSFRIHNNSTMGEAQCDLQCRREYLAGQIDDQFEGCISASSIPAAIADDRFGVGFRFPSRNFSDDVIIDCRYIITCQDCSHVDL